MVDRHWLGDLSLAILLALPLVALARPQGLINNGVAAPAAAKVTSTERLPGNGRISLLG